jgi:hypothetical protein
MASEHQNATLLILGGALEYQKVSNKLASIGTILEQVCVRSCFQLSFFFVVVAMLMSVLNVGKGTSQNDCWKDRVKTT